MSQNLEAPPLQRDCRGWRSPRKHPPRRAPHAACALGVEWGEEWQRGCCGQGGGAGTLSATGSALGTSCGKPSPVVAPEEVLGGACLRRLAYFAQGAKGAEW